MWTGASTGPARCKSQLYGREMVIAGKFGGEVLALFHGEDLIQFGGEDLTQFGGEDLGGKILISHMCLQC